MSAINEDPSGWQLQCSSLLERNSQMLRNTLLSDVNFVVVEDDTTSAGEPIPAHKYVLAISSPVFFAMFYGEIAEKTNSIKIPDSDRESFIQFLSFLYTDKCSLTMDSVSVVFYLAKKYMVPALISHCIDYLIKNLTAQNVFSILPLAIQFEEAQLVSKCWNIIEIQCTEAISSEGFLRVSHAIMKELLNRDTLDVQEIVLFKACSRWADYQCRRNNLPNTPEEKRKVLGDALFMIRYPVMGEDRFARDVVQTNLLPYEATVHVFLTFKNLAKEQRFSKKQRKKRWEIVVCNRYSDSKAKYYLPLVKDRDNSGLPDRLAFTVNKKAMIHGVRLFGEHTGEKYKVKLEISDNNNEVVGLKEGDFVSKVMNYQEKGLYVFDVFFNDPVEVKIGTRYTLAALLQGPRTCYAINASSSVDASGVIFTFFDVDNSYSETSVRTGQFMNLFFSLNVTPESCEATGKVKSETPPTKSRLKKE